MTFKGKLFRITKWFGLLAFAFVLLISAVIGGLMVQYPVRAFLWHCTHSRFVNVGNRRLELPLSWWRGEDTDYGAIVLRHAEVGSRIVFIGSDLGTSDLVFAPQKPGRTVKDDKLATTIQHELAAKNRFTPIEISAPIGKIYCIKDQSLPKWPFLKCFSSSLPWTMTFINGAGDAAEAERQAESILATLK